MNGGPAVGPVEPRPAATVVLLRAAGTGPEVLLARRPASMAFAPDMHVFPGGRVDAADRDPRLVARSAITPAAAADALGGDLAPAAAHGAFVAAVRECFEEAGVLLADAPTPIDLEAARASLLADGASFPDIVESLDLRLRTDLLVPLSRWVTPPTLARRFDARFFVAALPDDVTVSLVGDEVVDQSWWTPRAALDAMADGVLGMWLPTSTTLQQLEHVGSIEEVRERLAPRRLRDIEVVEQTSGIVRITMPAAGGIAGQPVHAYLVGRRDVVIVDPGDPTGPALERAIAVARERGGRIVAVALTHVDPDHAAGAEALAEILGVPVFGGLTGAEDLPYDVEPVDDATAVPLGDVPLLAVATPGPHPGHLAFVVGLEAHTGDVAVLCGDLDGRRGARSIPGPPDRVAWDASTERLRQQAPGAHWLGGHPAPS